MYIYICTLTAIKVMFFYFFWACFYCIPARVLLGIFSHAYAYIAPYIVKLAKYYLLHGFQMVTVLLQNVGQNNAFDECYF